MQGLGLADSVEHNSWDMCLMLRQVLQFLTHRTRKTKNTNKYITAAATDSQLVKPEGV